MQNNTSVLFGLNSIDYIVGSQQIFFSNRRNHFAREPVLCLQVRRFAPRFGNH